LNKTMHWLIFPMQHFKTIFAILTFCSISATATLTNVQAKTTDLGKQEKAAANNQAFHSDFNHLEGWKDDSAEASPKSYKIENGALYMSTRADTHDRVKIATKQRFGLGEYQWKVFCPALGKGDQASIGAFLYNNDKNEIDFEIGYGKKELRDKLNAQADDLVCYLTTQGNPFHSSQILFKRNKTYTLTLKLSSSDSNHINIQWLIDGKTVKNFQSKIPADLTFTAHCSVENLLFMGDHIPKLKSWATFDHFTHTPIAPLK